MPPEGTPDGNAQDDVRRAAERVTLACRALRAAANDLRLARVRSGAAVAEDAADLVDSETERVCEMAEQVAKLSGQLAGTSLATGFRG